MTRDRTTLTAAAVLVALAAVAACGAALPPAFAWGVNASRFLPAPQAVALAGLALFAPFAVSGVLSRAIRVPRAFLAMSALCAWGVALWTFRVSHVLLGDGIPITTTLPDDRVLHPREPLASWVLQQAWRLLGPESAAPGAAREHAVAQVAGLASVLAGLACAVGAYTLAREALRAFALDDSRQGRECAAFFACALLAQGASLVFFGYVEHYAWPAACGVWLWWALLRVLRGAAPPALALSLFALGFAFHFSTLVLAPPLLVVLTDAVVRPGRRAALLRDVGLAALAGIIAVALLRTRGYDAVAHLRDLVASNRSALGYLLSAAHVRDFANEHARIGPLGLPLFAALAVPLAVSPRVSLALRSLLLVGGATIVVATWRTPDMPLGYARDWDVFAAAGLALATIALLALLALARSVTARRLLLGGALAVSLLHTLPWIALNHDAGASVARFATLPLGLGRTESTLAWWHLQRGEYPESRRWIEASLRANPDNIRAVDLYGRVALLERRPDLAIDAYRRGVRMRPDRPEYRLQLAWALQAAGRPIEALAALDTLEFTHPDDPTLWLQRAVGHEALGRRDTAGACLARALRLSPTLAGAARQVLPALMEDR